jgi:hypothetical protein
MEDYKNNFFIFIVLDKKVRWEFLYQIERRDVVPYEIRETNVRKRFEIFQEIRVFPTDKKKWENEKEFFSRYNRRIPPTNKSIYYGYIEKYEVILKWLRVSFNKKERFLENLKRDYENNKLDCYETRLEEIFNICTSTERKYWKTQCTISSRRHRTNLFESRMFKHRNDKDKGYCDNFGFEQKSFKHRVLYDLRQKLIFMLGHKFEVVEYEGEMLNSMASNSEWFGSAMFRYILSSCTRNSSK